MMQKQRSFSFTTRLLKASSLSIYTALGVIYGGDLESQKDAFHWQNGKHYNYVVSLFKTLSEKELTNLLKQLTLNINHKDHLPFFDQRCQSMMKRLNESFDGWIKEEISYKRYLDELTSQENSINQDNSDELETDDEDEWRLSYKRGYERSGTESDNGQDRDDERTSLSAELSDDEEEDEPFKKWQIRTINDLFISYPKYLGIDDIEKKQIDPDLMNIFLKKHCDGGGGLRYSWLINEIVEGSLSTSEDFTKLASEKMSVPKDLLDSIFGGLWFYYDWEEYDIKDHDFIQKTYIKAINKMNANDVAQDVKERLLKRIFQLFSFNQDDFEAPFRDIHERYNESISRKNWRGAMVEWALYVTYRKVFAHPLKKSGIQGYENKDIAIPTFQSFNKEDYLLKCLNDAYIRSQSAYTKVYPHLNTKKVVYGPASDTSRAELDLQTELASLKEVGQFWEKKRSSTRKRENVFVPKLYVIVSKNTNQQSPMAKKHFLSIPMMHQTAPNRPLTSAVDDQVFREDVDAYFKEVKNDVITGRMLQGVSKEEAENDITKLLNNKVARGTDLVHSERVFVHLTRKESFVTDLSQTLSNVLQKDYGEGTYTVYGGVVLAYSTNTVCPNCTPTLITLQNSHEKGGFMNRFVSELVKKKGPVTYTVKGYHPQTNQMDWSQFRLNTFVTATINFDSQAHDLVDDDQRHRPVKKTQPHHIPHTKLFFPNDEIDVSDVEILENGHADSNQRFFYEFVGKDIHPQEKDKVTYIDKKKKKSNFAGVVLSSGSKAWKV